MPDLEISRLPELQGPGLATTDVVPLADMSASETKKITAKNLIQSGIALIDAGSIPYDKINVPAVTIPDGAVTTDKIADGAVTDIKVNDVSGSKIINGTVTGPKLGAVTDRGLDQATGVIGITNDVTPSSSAGISWNAQGLITGATSPIPADDLPVATGTTTGIVSVPNAGGLAVSGTGEIGIAYTTTPNIVSNIAYNQFGQILYVNPLAPTDLPIATDSTLGVVKVPVGDGLLVDGDGDIGLSNTGVISGTYTKITVDEQGRATNAAQLTAADIPKLAADTISSGTFPGTRIGDREIEERHLADYSTCYVQEGQPTEDPKLGQFWFTPSTNQLRVYGRGSGSDLWLSVGFGALQQANLRWGGTVNASTSNITTLTDIGVSEGLTAGEPVPAPTDELSGLYFVVDTAGTAITIPSVNGATCTEGDWILYIDQAQGAVHLDVSAGGGGGGGGGAAKLDDLSDVQITAPAAGQFLEYNATSGKWLNVTLLNGGDF